MYDKYDATRTWGPNQIFCRMDGRSPSPTSAPTAAPTYSPDLSPSFDGFFLNGVWKGCYKALKSYQTENPSTHYGKNRMTILSFDGLPPASMIASATLKLKKTWDGSKHSWSGCPSSNNYEFKQVTTSGLDDSCDGQANSARGYNFGSTKTKKTISASLGAKSVDLTSFVQSLAGTGTSNSISFSIAGVSKGCLSAFAAHEATAEADRPTLELTFNEETDATSSPTSAPTIETSSPTSAPPAAPTYSPDLQSSFDGFFLDGVWKGCYKALKSYQTKSPSTNYGENRMIIMSFDGLPPASMIAS